MAEIPMCDRCGGPRLAGHECIVRGEVKYPHPHVVVKATGRTLSPEYPIADRERDPDAAVFWPALIVDPAVAAFVTSLRDVGSRVEFSGQRSIAYVAHAGRHFRVTVEEVDADRPPPEMLPPATLLAAIAGDAAAATASETRTALAIYNLCWSAGSSVGEELKPFPERAVRLEILGIAVGCCAEQIVRRRGDSSRESWVDRMDMLNRALARELAS